MDKITLPQAELYFIEDSIIKIDMLHNEEMEVPQIKEIFEAYLKLANGKPFSTLTDLSKSIGSSSNEARQYAADNSNSPNKIADALVFATLAKKLMANFYIQFNKPKCLTRAFTSVDAALKWLKKVKKDNPKKSQKHPQAQ